MAMSETIKKKCEMCAEVVEESVEELKFSRPYLLADMKDIQSGYVCEYCYGSNWDAGFAGPDEDYTDEMHIKDFNLEKLAKNKVLSEDVETIMKLYGPGHWHCLNCKKERPRNGDLAAQVKQLCAPCPFCHLPGNLVYSP